MNAGQKADAAAVLERARLRAIARAEVAERERDELEERRNTLAGQVLRYEAQGWASTFGRRAEAAETALRELRVWLEACDHPEECPASNRGGAEPCLCGLTRSLELTHAFKRARTTSTEERDG